MILSKQRKKSGKILAGVLSALMLLTAFASMASPAMATDPELGEIFGEGSGEVYEVEHAPETEPVPENEAVELLGDAFLMVNSPESVTISVNGEAVSFAEGDDGYYEVELSIGSLVDVIADDGFKVSVYRVTIDGGTDVLTDSVAEATFVLSADTFVYVAEYTPFELGELEDVLEDALADSDGDYQICPLIEAYIRENMDHGLVPEGDLYVVNYLIVKQTFIDAAAGFGRTDQEVLHAMTEQDVLALLGMTQTVVPMFMTPDSEYLVAFADTMLFGYNNQLTSHIFARYDFTGTEIPGHLDTDTGLVYIHMDQFMKDGEFVIGRNQIQFVQRIGSPRARSGIALHESGYSIVEQDNELSLFEDGLFDIESKIFVGHDFIPGLNDVLVNGILIDHNEVTYNRETGYLTLHQVSTADVLFARIVPAENPRLGRTISFPTENNFSIGLPPGWQVGHYWDGRASGNYMAGQNVGGAHSTIWGSNGGGNWFGMATDGTDVALLNLIAYGTGNINSFGLIGSGVSHPMQNQWAFMWSVGMSNRYLRPTLNGDLVPIPQNNFIQGNNTGTISLYSTQGHDMGPSWGYDRGQVFCKQTWVLSMYCAHGNNPLWGDVPPSQTWVGIDARIRLLQDHGDGTVTIGILTPRMNNQTGAVMMRVRVEEPRTGELDLLKVSGNPGMTSTNPNYSLAGARYGVYANRADAEAHRNRLHSLVTDANGNSQVIEIEAGTYYVREYQASPGFMLDTTPHQVTVNPGERATVRSIQPPRNDPEFLIIEKLCSSGIVGGQGGASLAGAQFRVNFYYSNDGSGTPVATRIFETQPWTNGRAGFSLEVASHMISGPPMPTDGSGNVIWPLGSVSVQEILPPPGFIIDPNRYVGRIFPDDSVPWGADFEWLTDTPMVGRTPDGVTVYNEAIHGGIEIEKVDRELNLLERIINSIAQGSGSLEGIDFDIRTLNESDVVVYGNTFSRNDVVTTITTAYETENGVVRAVARTSDTSLPAGIYEIQEVRTNDTYLLTDGEPRRFEITENGVFVTATVDGDDMVFSNYVVRGDVLIIKHDIELDESEAIGGRDPVNGTTLEGIQFTFTNVNNQHTIVPLDGELIAPGEVALVRYSEWLEDENAYGVKTTNRTFPVGRWRAQETATNNSYLLTDGTPRYFEIREDGELVRVDVNGVPLIWRNQVRRGDFEFVKIEEGTHRRVMAPFAVRNVTTEETNVVVSDRNGQFNSHHTWNDRALANVNNHLLEMEAAGDRITISDMNPYGSVWFGLGEFGSMASVDSTLGALPYGLYNIREMRAETNEGLQLFDFYFFVSRHGVVINLGTMTNFPYPNVFVCTTATTGNGTQYFNHGDVIDALDRILLTHTDVPNIPAHRNRAFEARLMAVITELVDEDEVVTIEEIFTTGVVAYEQNQITMEFNKATEVDTGEFPVGTWFFWTLDAIDHEGVVVYTHNADGSIPEQAIRPLDKRVTIATQAHTGDGSNQYYVWGEVIDLWDDVKIEHIGISLETGVERFFRGWLFNFVPCEECHELGRPCDMDKVTLVYVSDYYDYTVENVTEWFRIMTSVDTSEFDPTSIFFWAETAYGDPNENYDPEQHDPEDPNCPYGPYDKDAEHNFDGSDQDQNLYPRREVRIATQAHTGDGETQTFTWGEIIAMYDDIEIEHVDFVIDGSIERSFRGWLFAYVPCDVCYRLGHPCDRTEVTLIHVTDHQYYTVENVIEWKRIVTNVDTSEFDPSTIFFWAETSYGDPNDNHDPDRHDPRDPKCPYGPYDRDADHNFDGKDQDQNLYPEPGVVISTQAHTGDGRSQYFLHGEILDMFDDIEIRHIGIAPGTARAFRAWLFVVEPDEEPELVHVSEYQEYTVQNVVMFFTYVRENVYSGEWSADARWFWAETAYGGDNENYDPDRHDPEDPDCPYGPRIKDGEHNFDGTDKNQDLHPRPEGRPRPPGGQPTPPGGNNRTPVRTGDFSRLPIFLLAGAGVLGLSIMGITHYKKKKK